MFNSSPNPSCSLLEWQLIANRSSEFGHVQLVPKYKSKVKLPREQSPNILSEMIKSQENGISLLVIFVDRQKECISKNCEQIEPFSFLLSKSDSSSSPDKYLVTVSFKTKYDLKSQKHCCCMTEMSYSLQCQTIVALVVTIVSSETVRVLGLNTM